MNTSAMLEDLGHTVFEAKSGQEALRILRERGVDLVITDHAMPQMTGAQLAEAIKAEWPRMPVIMATGYAELPSNAADLPRLAKPFTQAAIAAAVGRAIADQPIQT
jgi:CheY-like chemotaxis protein